MEGTLLGTILSSAVVAALVTIILSHVFEQRRYLRDKKIQAYTNFLDQLHKILPDDAEVTRETVAKHMFVEASRLERPWWQLKIVGSKRVNKIADKVYWKYQKIVEQLGGKIDKGLADEILERLRTIEEARTELLEAMSEDVQKRPL